MYCAKGIRKRRISNKTTAWIIPATGVLPPLLMFVIVRAMAPVAGIPPNNGVIRLAVPWAISSVFESCLSPVTPSATVADNNDSIAPKTAMVIATGNKSLMASQLSAGMVASGNSDLIVKRSPMVSMVSIPAYVFNKYTTAVTTMMAIREPGIFFENRGVMAIMMILAILTIVFHQLIVSKWRK